jgi:uncharacterized protein
MRKFFFDNTEMSSVALPVQQNERIAIIDAIRGVALLGILLMNIPYFGMPHQIGFNLNVRNEYSGINYYTWWIVNTFFEGTMRGLFSILFGAGSILLLSRLEKKNSVLSAADVYYRRLIWLLIFGLFNAFILLWPGDILYSYALCGLFLFPFRNLKSKWLLIFAFAFILMADFRGTLDFYGAKEKRVKGEQALALEKQKVKLTEEQEESKKKWEGMKERMKTENIQKEAEKEKKKVQQGYFKVMEYYKDINVKIESSSFYDSYFWDVMGFLFLGMALFKMGVVTGEKSTKYYLVLLFVGYIVGIGLAYFMNRTFVSSKFDFTLIADKMKVSMYQIKRLFLSMGHIGLLMTLYKTNLFNWLFKWLSKVGQMAFTNYLSQSIICTLIFYGYGLRWFGYVQRYQLYLIVFGVWIFQIIFSNIWLHYFKFGPFEWAWRSLTYWKKQPFKKKNEVVSAMAE